MPSATRKKAPASAAEKMGLRAMSGYMAERLQRKAENTVLVSAAATKAITSEIFLSRAARYMQPAQDPVQLSAVALTVITYAVP